MGFGQKTILRATGEFLAGFVVASQNNRLMYLLTSFNDLLMERRGNAPEFGHTKYEPVTFDMDRFGGKKVCTK